MTKHQLSESDAFAFDAINAAAVRPVQLRPEAVYELDKEARAAWVRLSRSHASPFCEYVLRSEENGAPIRQSPMHDEWHQLLDASNRTIIWSHVEAGKTQQLSVGRTLWEIGRNTSTRCVVLANTANQSTKIVTSVANYIANSEEYREVFPNVIPAKPWTTSTLNVRRKTIAKDFTVQSTGVGGHIIGARIDCLVADDVLDFENTRTAENRKEIVQWFHSEMVGRLTRKSRVWVVGNAYYPDDLLHYLAKHSKYVARVYPLVDRKTGAVRFPDAWPADRIKQKREELGPVESARQLDCRTRSKDSARCSEESIRKNFANGAGRSMLMGLPPAHRELPDRLVITGVDLGVGAQKSSGKTAFATVRFWLGGPRRGMRDLLRLKSGHYSGPTLLQEIEWLQRAFGGMVAVESNAAQMFMVQLAHTGIVAGVTGTEEEMASANILRELSVRPVNTGMNKWHPQYGIEGMFLEFHKGLWCWPSVDGVNPPTETVAELAGQCVSFSPEAHTGDELMAIWLAREGFRKYGEDFSMLGRGGDNGQVGVSIPGAETPSPKGEGLAPLIIAPERADVLSGWEHALRRS